MNELYILSRQNSRSNRADFSWFSCCLFLDQSPRNKRWQIPIRSYLIHHSGANLWSFFCLCKNFFLLLQVRTVWCQANSETAFFLLCSLVISIRPALLLDFYSYLIFRITCSQQSLHPLQLSPLFLIAGATCVYVGSFCKTISYLCQKLSLLKPLPQESLWHPLKELHLMTAQDTNTHRW